MDYADMPSFERVDLDRLTFAFGRAISAKLVDTFAIPAEVAIIRTADEIAFRIRQDVLAQHLERATVRYPATWREAVKAAFYVFCAAGHWPWFAEYAAKRWPVVEHIVQIDVKALYPKIACPHESHHVTVLRQVRQELR